jgi:tetrahydromethanopterin S-methyltransferase subunit E
MTPEYARRASGDVIAAFVVLAVLTALTVYVAGWDCLVFGIAAAFAVGGVKSALIGVAIALLQALRMVRRRYHRRYGPWHSRG